MQAAEMGDAGGWTWQLPNLVCSEGVGSFSLLLRGA